MNERLALIALGAGLILGCQTPDQRMVSNSISASSSVDLDVELGERAEPDEAETNQRMADTTVGYIHRRYSEGRHPALRDAHAKGHGCVRATFDVDPGLPGELKHGVFVPGKQYKAWIRYSNGDSEINPDKTKDARGMAIKLTGVDGEKLLEGEKNATTQDFIMINHPFFFVDNPKEYLGALNALHAKMVTEKPNIFNALGAAMQLGIHNTGLAREISGTRIANPLYEQYWSMTPYRLGVGPGKKAVKFLTKPCSNNRPGAPGFFSRPQADYLKMTMADSLESTSACFKFYLQTFKDIERTPIEQSTVEWKEAAAPPILVATVTIPAQKFDSPEQMDFCENLSYTPWHALPEHKPLGAVNRARQVIYTAVSKVRHELNDAPRAEPTGDETF